MSKCGYCYKELGSAIYKLGDCECCLDCYNFYKSNYEYHNTSKHDLWKKVIDLQSQLAESEKEIASIQVLLSENAIDRKAMQEFKIGEDEYDLTDEDARNSLCWEVEELKQQLADKYKEIEQVTSKLPASYEKEQNQKAIEQLEKVKEKFGYKHNSQLVISSKNLVEFIDKQINKLK